MIRATGVAAAVAALGLLVTPLAAGAGPATYTDPTGDSASAPDITKIVITDNGTTWGFEVDLATVQDLADNSVVGVALDTDRNRGTGDSTGIDYAVFASAGGLAFDKWDGTRFSPFTHTSTNPALSDGRLTFTVTKADVGSPATFDFYAVSVHGNDEDDAPNGNTIFTWPAAAPTIVKVLVPAATLTPHAGKLLTVSGVSVQMSDQTTVAPSSLTCSLTLAGRGLAKTGACSWRIPKKAKGRTVLLKLVIAVGSQHVTRTFALKVR